MSPGRLAWLVLAWVALVGSQVARGHGGSFPPPPDVPPSGPGGKYLGPGDITSGPTTPAPGTQVPSGDVDDGPGGPSTGAGGARPPAPPGTGPATGGPPVTGGSRGPASGLGRKQRDPTTIDSWERWWALNREPFLAQPLARVLTVSTSAPQPEGMTGREGVRDVVRPALLHAVHAEDPLVLDSAAIALGRSLHPADADEAVAELHRLLASPYPSVRQAAILALGILRHRASAPILWAVMNDTRQGRTMLARTATVPGVERAFAALAIGFLGDQDLVPALLDRALRRDGEVEVSAAAVLAIGLIHDSAPRALPGLMQALGDARLDTRVRAQIPITLGRLGEAAAATLPMLLRIATETREDTDLRRSAVIALGRLAGPEDAEVVVALRRIQQRESDAPMRHFAIMALGRLGARSARHDAEHPRVGEIGRALRDEIALAKRTQDRPWAALAAGVLGNGLPADHALRLTLASDIRQWLQRSSAPSEEGAAAIALGLLGAREAGDLLLERFRERHDRDLRVHLATALGLLEHKPAAEDLLAVVLERHDAALRVEAAMALARIGHEDAGNRLFTLLQEAPTFAAAASIARPLGRIGDPRHLRPLADLISDATRPAPTRGFACVALGMIAEKTPLPWNAPLAVDANYALALSAQDEVLDIF